jgi:diadenosine tetraphosphatase ApaH/serine/threonine PP2A family protein phosphatase
MSSGKIFAILGDIHSNIDALTAVLDDARAHGVNHFACVGDAVGYNANPSECLATIQSLNCVSVVGNHDHYCINATSLHDFHPMAADVVNWTRSHLSTADVAFLRGLKLVRVVSGFTLVHSTLDMPDKWGYVFDELEAASNFNYQSTTVCFHGHTHHPVVFEKTNVIKRTDATVVKIALGRKYFINVGSVGQPRDGNPRASYAIYDVDKRVVTFRRIEYDICKAQKKIIDAGLPPRLAQRLAQGL